MTHYEETALPQLIDPDGRFGDIIVPAVSDMGYRLIRVGFSGADPKRGAILQVMIEPKDGSKLGVDACKTVSQALSAEMDVADPITENYVLEVGSAGLDRPLSDTRDFARFSGWEAKIERKRADEDGQRRYRGFIENVTQNGFDLKTQEKGNVTFEWAELSAARLVASDNLLKALQNGTV